MCLICKRHKNKSQSQEQSNAGKYQSGTGEFINFRLGDQQEQFNRVHGKIQKKMGTRVTRSQAVRHCIAFTDQHYEDEIGL